MKPPPARARTSASLIGVSLNTKSSMSLASGSLEMVNWRLIDRACFSAEIDIPATGRQTSDDFRSRPRNNEPRQPALQRLTSEDLPKSQLRGHDRRTAALV